MSQDNEAINFKAFKKAGRITGIVVLAGTVAVVGGIKAKNYYSVVNEKVKFADSVNEKINDPKNGKELRDVLIKSGAAKSILEHSNEVKDKEITKDGEKVLNDSIDAKYSLGF
jgi:hypothetical protein